VRTRQRCEVSLIDDIIPYQRAGSSERHHRRCLSRPPRPPPTAPIMRQLHSANEERSGFALRRNAVCCHNEVAFHDAPHAWFGVDDAAHQIAQKASRRGRKNVGQFHTRSDELGPQPSGRKDAFGLPRSESAETTAKLGSRMRSPNQAEQARISKKRSTGQKTPDQTEAVCYVPRMRTTTL